MATTLDIARLIQQNLVDKKDKPKPDRYNIYQLLRHTDGRYGVVTRSGIFDGETPKLSLISGKFHDDEDKARTAYEALITKMKESKGATDGSYKFNPKANEEWEALTNSVEKRQRAIEERRAKKAQKDREEPKEEEMVEEVVEVVEEEEAGEEVEEAEEEVEEKAEIIQIEDPNLFKDEEPAEKKEEKKPKRKGGRKAVVPDHFEVDDEDREEHWQAMNQKSRRAWKRENPVEE